MRACVCLLPSFVTFISPSRSYIPHLTRSPTSYQASSSPTTPTHSRRFLPPPSASSQDMEAQLHQNPATLKRNVLASFTSLLLLPVTIVPRTVTVVGGAVGGALIAGGGAAVQGIAMLNPQRWVGGGSGSAGRWGGRGATTTTNGGGTGTGSWGAGGVGVGSWGVGGTKEKEGYSRNLDGAALFEIEDEDEDGEDVGVGMEKSSAIGNMSAGSEVSPWGNGIKDDKDSRMSIFFDYGAYILLTIHFSFSNVCACVLWWLVTLSQLELTSPTPLMGGSSPAPLSVSTADPSLHTPSSIPSHNSNSNSISNSNSQQLDLLLSLDVALEIIHADRESLKRVETFTGYPGHYGHRVRDTIEEIFVLALGALGERHVVRGFMRCV